MGHIICLFFSFWYLFWKFQAWCPILQVHFCFLWKKLGPSLGVTPDFKWQNDMIEWGQKSKPKKIPPDQNLTPKKPMLNFRAIKIFRGTTQPGYVGIIRRNYHESSDCLEYPTKSLVKSNYPKKYLPNFPYPKKSWNQKFQTSKNRSIIPVTWNPEYLPWELGVMLMAEHENNPCPWVLVTAKWEF